MAKRLDEVDYYALLGVAPDATADAIRDAFHRFARRYHPDRYAGDPTAVARSARVYRRGTEAYRVLNDALRRKAYDAGLSRGQLRYDPEQARPQRPTLPPAQAAAPPAARPFIAEAQQALRRGDLKQARLQLQVALHRAPDNAELQRMLQQVEQQLSLRS